MRTTVPDKLLKITREIQESGSASLARLAFGRGADEAVDVGGLRRLLHLRAAGAGLAVGDVVLHRVVWSGVI